MVSSFSFALEFSSLYALSFFYLFFSTFTHSLTFSFFCFFFFFLFFPFCFTSSFFFFKSKGRVEEGNKEEFNHCKDNRSSRHIQQSTKVMIWWYTCKNINFFYKTILDTEEEKKKSSCQAWLLVFNFFFSCCFIYFILFLGWCAFLFSKLKIPCADTG